MARARLADQALRDKILELLDENRVMTVATLRRDGWPQATLVGYVRDEFTLYFVVARRSQKLANIRRDARVSVALGQESPHRLRGLSMAAWAEEVDDVGEISRLDALAHARYPGEVVFSPRRASSAVIRTKPSIISIIDLPRGPGDPQLVTTGARTSVRRLKTSAEPVDVRYTHAQDRYRPDAPP